MNEGRNEVSDICCFNYVWRVYYYGRFFCLVLGNNIWPIYYVFIDLVTSGEFVTDKVMLLKRYWQRTIAPD
jgi:hypothetical protein